MHTGILLPDNASAKYADRAALCNAVGIIEKARNAQLAREIEIALSAELTREQNISLAREFVNGKSGYTGALVSLVFAVALPPLPRPLAKNRKYHFTH